MTVRDKNCGVLSFHPNTELSLLLHVRNSLLRDQEKGKKHLQQEIGAPKATMSNYDNDQGMSLPSKVLHLIDVFCKTRHWMMHVGPQKGEIVIDTALEKSLQLYHQQRHQSQPFIAVEIGTYCGYSSIMLAQRLYKECVRILSLRNLKDPDHLQNENFDPFHLFTYEVNESHARIATELIELAGLSGFVSVFVLQPDDRAATILYLRLVELLPQEKTPQVHFLFVDHDKEAYLKDVQAFEGSQLLQPGSVVCADNVLFANIIEYIKHMNELQREGIAQTETIPSFVEYYSHEEEAEFGLDRLRDGVGKYCWFFFVCNLRTCTCVFHVLKSQLRFYS